ncbi:putative periplasmic lipoprotein [Hartmannibacter diazotrophicus]|uniref:Putative periplasmic lipoprotein n=1 Tax=Hartmannibacter diazotrophicus TaxID=1482074 RepID=A0A2C9D3B2_9HYPH|nr:imelysin family protein [Hartmannibacter diazotrophicus]SON54817.1 putative periplasmic lipoprotein [Hartmannibacter diazotrophicus]
MMNGPGSAAFLAGTLLLTCLTPVAALAQARGEGSTQAANLSEAEFGAIVANAIDGEIRPGFKALAAKADVFWDDAKALCKAPDAAHLDTARKAFAATVTAWSRVEFWRFGPLMEEHRLERMAFWPDARSLGLKQVQAALAKKDDTATSVESLVQKSVAMQGLTALDYLLYGSGAETLGKADDAGGAYRCHYAEAAAANVADMAGQLQTAWTGPDGAAALFEKPGSNNPLFQTSKEAAGELFQQVATGLEIIGDHKLKVALGKSVDDAKPKLAPFWRSGLTMATVAANFEGLRGLVEASGAGKKLDPSLEWLDNSIRFEFDNAIDAARKLDKPIEDVVTTPDDRKLASYLVLKTLSIRDNVGSDLVAGIGLEKGFNSLDGD